MNNLLGSLVWRGISETLLVKQDIKRFRGKKNVIVAMAVDRNHPEMQKADALYAKADLPDDFVFVKEDHPNGPLHTRFKVGAQDFRFVVVDKDGAPFIDSGRTLGFEEVQRTQPHSLH